MTSQRITIALDVDGVLADLTGRFCSYLRETGAYNPEIRGNLTPEDFKVYSLAATLNPAERRCLDIFSHLSGACTSIPWYLGARAFVETLKDMGEVFAVTAPWHAPTWASERVQWLSPVIDSAHVVSCRAEAKPFTCAAADVFIEDHPGTLASWLHTCKPGAAAILIDRPWNRDAPQNPRIHRVFSLAEAARLVARKAQS